MRLICYNYVLNLYENSNIDCNKKVENRIYNLYQIMLINLFLQ